MKKLYSLLALAAACAMSATAVAPLKSLNIQRVDQKRPLIQDTATKSNAPSRIEVIIPGTGDEGTWSDMGTGTFIEDFFTRLFGIQSVSMNVLIQESDDIEGLIRIVNPYAEYPYNGNDGYIATTDRYWYFNIADPNKVFMCNQDGNAWNDKFEYPVLETGCDYGYGEIMITSGYNYFGSYGAYLTAKGEDGSEYTAISLECLGTNQDGVISFPAESWKCAMANYENGDWIAPGNIDRRFRIILPDTDFTDYSFTLSTEGCAADNQVVVEIEKADPVTKIFYITISETFDVSFDDAAYYLENYPDKFVVVEGNSITFNMPATARGTVLAIGTDAEGNLQSFAFTNIYGNGETEDWHNIGKGQLTDDMLSPWYDYDVETVEVGIQANNTTAGYYRVVNPFDNLSWLGKKYENSHATDHNHYMYIDATDPNKVIMEESPVGMNLGYGTTIVSSMPILYLKNGKEPDATLYGKMEGQEITFPVNGLLISEYSQVGSWSYANLNGAFKLVVPEDSGVEGVIADQENAPAVYYNLQGQRVTNPSTGLYIVRQGRNVTKTIIK